DEEGAEGAASWYADGDNDGFGVEEYLVVACEAPNGYADASGDCDDTSPAVNPDATEVCNGIDDDCDDQIDGEDVDEPDTWYLDVDGDGYGDDDITEVTCDATAGYVIDGGDCDDDNPEAYPGRREVCDGADNDCDGLTDDEDEDMTGEGTWYLDADGDGYGDPDAQTVEQCEQPSGYVS
ncbi:MAG: putative metal-binding motif-containing protein, partial [Myxococcota bacterium]|nr:putative metal-binding motif-containing protein [Myxococcota bacterium]